MSAEKLIQVLVETEKLRVELEIALFVDKAQTRLGLASMRLADACSLLREEILFKRRNAGGDK